MVSAHPKNTRIAKIHENLSLPYLTHYIHQTCRFVWTRLLHAPNSQLQPIGTDKSPSYATSVLSKLPIANPGTQQKQPETHPLN